MKAAPTGAAFSRTGTPPRGGNGTGLSLASRFSREAPVRILVGAVVLSVLCAQAAAQPACAPRDVVLKKLAEDFQETPVGLGLSANGSVLELLTSAEGTSWTLLVTRPGGLTCLVASGEDWTMIARRAPAPEERGT